MCSPRRVKDTKQKGVLLWMLEAERQRKQRELKSLEQLAHCIIGTMIVMFIAIVGVFVYMIIK